MKIREVNKVLLGVGVVGAGLLVALGRPSIADPGTGAAATQSQGNRGARMMQHLTRMLGLSADQQSQIGGILGDARAKLHSLRSDKSLTREQRHEQAKAIFQSARAAIRADLTPDQQTKFDQMIARRMAHRQNHTQ